MSDQRKDQAANSRRGQLTQQLRDQAMIWCQQHLATALDALEQELFRLADIAGDNLNQSRYWQARNALIRQRDRVEQGFASELDRAWQAFLVDQPVSGDAAPAADPAPDDEAEALALVEEDHLERSIAIDSLSRRSSAAHSEALYALQQRLAILAGGRKISESGNPLAPAVHARALDRALRSFPADNRAHLLSLKFCDSAYMSHLGSLYRQLNQQLREAGILPNLRHDLRKSGDAAVDKTDTGAPGSNSDGDTRSAARQRELLALIRHLRGNLPGAPVAPAASLIPILASLQRESAGQLAATPAAASPTPETAPSAAQTLTSISGAGQGGLGNHEVIELVGFLFDYMLADEQLPDAVKALLSYLHTPFLKLALLDQSLVENPGHPARNLFNSMVAAGEQWVEPEGKQRSEVFRKMKSLVQRVLDEFSEDARLFAELDSDFNQFLHQHGHRVQLAEQRAREAAEGEQRLRNARLQAEQFIARRTRDRVLPPPLRTLLFEPWSSYLTFVILRHGTDSDEWRRAGGSVDEILWYASPAAAAADQAPRARALLDELRNGLQAVGFDTRSGEALLAALPGCRLTQPVAGPTEPDSPEQPVPAATAPASRAAAKPPGRDPEHKALLALAFGTWFLFGAHGPRRQQQRLKLAWSNTRTGHFMFVNALGQQAAVHDVHALARAINNGEARVLGQLEQKPFFERALERVAEQLGRNQRAQGT